MRIAQKYMTTVQRILLDPRSVLPWLLLIGLGAVLVRTAWLSDDAYITFRTADNFIHGYGLTWNISERVQTYTNPLWLFLFSACYWLTGEAYYTPIFLAIAVSLAAVAVLVRRVCATLSVPLCLALLLSSKAFVDFSTSGLENPLTHLLLALFLSRLLLDGPGCDIRYLALWSGLCVFNRMDTILLFAPGIAYATYSRGLQRARTTILHLLTGFSPLILWEVFAVVYYGFPFPNTAYAKLNTGIEPTVLALQGMRYLWNSLQMDPLTLPTIIVALYLVVRRRDPRQLAAAAGIIVYIIYVIRVGGDFMSGRFLAAPIFTAVALIGHCEWGSLRTFRRQIAAIATIVALGLLGPFPSLLSGVEYGVGGATMKRGIADERAGYYPTTGLLRAWKSSEPFPIHPWADMGREIRDTSKAAGLTVWMSVGFYGFYAGPHLHLVDELGLGDPLLSRLPSVDIPDWRIGHFERLIPPGYLRSHISGNIELTDERLALYLTNLRKVMCGELFETGRWREIWKFNTGQYDDLIDFERYRHPDRVDLLTSDLSTDPSDPEKRFNLAEEHCRQGNAGAGIATLTARNTFDSADFARRLRQLPLSDPLWNDCLARQIPSLPRATASEIRVHAAWITSTLERSQDTSQAGDLKTAIQLAKAAERHAKPLAATHPSPALRNLLEESQRRAGQLDESPFPLQD